MSAKRVLGFFGEYWPIIVTIFTVVTAVLSVFAVGLWAMFGAKVVAWTRDELGITELSEKVDRANGEDRVIRQPEGLSYIKEPVSEGEKVVMIMVAERTTLGKECRLTNWVPIFTDERNIPTPGERASSGPVSRQIDDDMVVLRIVMVPPDLRPGRVTVYLTLDYMCGGVLVPDRTRVLAYQLLAG